MNLCSKNNPSLGFSPSQRWRSTAEKDMFPYCKLQRVQIDVIRDQWQNVSSSEDIMAKFLNLHYLETNIIEGIVQFDPAVSFSFVNTACQSLLLISQATIMLIELGFYNRAELVNLNNPMGGTVQSRADALSILRDTHKVTHPCPLCPLGYY